ncbi:uncharacterized protein [Bombus flavifrons]|uniref:uncharacterized protein n=1 Tax=Bombus flavifrons TaxID=103934 RepID=UPI003704B57A
MGEPLPQPAGRAKLTKEKETTKRGTELINTSPNGTLHHDLLVTAQIDVLDKRALPIRARALLDTGSSMNFMTEKFANSLGMKRRRCSVPISALDDLTTIAKSQITATIVSIDAKYERTVTFLIIPTISSLVPDQPIDRSAIQISKNLRLADPAFHRPSPIEILLSSGPTLASLCVGQIKISQSTDTELCLQKTRFGWVIGGSPPAQSGIHSFHATTTDIQADFARFWEIDEGLPTTHFSESELQCEEHFRNHVQRNKEGRYIVALPFNEKLPTLGTSRSVAMSRLASLHRRFQRDKQFEATYSTVIQEYLDLGYMTKITHNHPSNNCYLHSPVVFTALTNELPNKYQVHTKYTPIHTDDSKQEIGTGYAVITSQSTIRISFPVSASYSIEI